MTNAAERRQAVTARLMDRQRDLTRQLELAKSLMTLDQLAELDRLVQAGVDPGTDEEPMSVWKSSSGRLHWLRRCSGGAGVMKVKRVSVGREQLEADRFDHTKVCMCLRKVNFEPGKRALS